MLQTNGLIQRIEQIILIWILGIISYWKEKGIVWSVFHSLAKVCMLQRILIVELWRLRVHQWERLILWNELKQEGVMKIIQRILHSSWDCMLYYARVSSKIITTVMKTAHTHLTQRMLRSYKIKTTQSSVTPSVNTKSLIQLSALRTSTFISQTNL